MSFRFAEDLDSIHVDLSEEEKMHLQGRIDRIDVSEDAEHVYVKVIDYKSGNKKFDLAALYYGLQLQLVVYMNAAMEHVVTSISAADSYRRHCCIIILMILR